MTDERETSRRSIIRSAIATGLGLGLAGCSQLPTESFPEPIGGGDGDGSGGSGGGDGGGGRDLRSIAYGETREGFVDREDGRDPEYDDLAEPVQFDGQAGDIVRIRMESDAFDTYVVLEGPNGATVAEMDDGGGDFNTLLETSLSQSGTYTIWCGSLSGDATGAYALTLTRTGSTGGDGGDSTPTDGGDGGGGRDLRSIAYGQTRQGFVDQGDGTAPEYGGLAEPVEFDGESGDDVRITMTADFDTYLVLQAPDGSVVAQNDDRPEDFNSRIVYTLQQSGTYTIWCTSWTESATGPYELTLTRGGSGDGGDGGGGQDLRSIAYGETREGFVDQNDGRDPEFNDLAEPVEFEGQSGDQIRITMESDPFDPYVVLEAPDGAVVATKDDGAGGFDTLLEHTLGQSGTYTVWCGSLSGDATGSYTLTLERVGSGGDGGSGRDLRSIAYGESKQGFVDQGDGTAPEYGGLAEPVEFEGQSGDQIRIRMDSDPFDPYVVLQAPDGSVVAQQDDGGGNFNTLLEYTLQQSGTYTIWCTSWTETATGTYTLTLERTN